MSKRAKESKNLSCLTASTNKTSPSNLGLCLDGRDVFSGENSRLFTGAEDLDPAT